MKKIQNNSGLTLFELLVAITAGTLVTIAATTVLLLGLRIFSTSNRAAMRQNEVRVGISVIETLVAEGPVVSVGGDWIMQGERTQAEGEDGQIVNDLLVYYEDGAILTGAGATVLENVEAFEVNWVGNVLTFWVTVNGETYESKVYCRNTGEINYEELDAYDPKLQDAIGLVNTGVEEFLEILGSQLGSDGRIMEGGQYIDEYYASWYNEDWGEGTPWCACFVSWALYQCRGYLENADSPRHANVDNFMAQFVSEERWHTDSPQAGDIVFFDWIINQETNPQHVGVYLATMDGYIYTIEGNTSNTVAVRRYPKGDKRIIGYGRPAWDELAGGNE